MLKKLNKLLLLEKIPPIVCLMACTASVLMGFAVGYVFFGPGEYLAYADSADTYQPHQAEAPNMAGIYIEAPIPPSPQQPEPDLEEEAYLYLVTTMDGYIVIYHASENGGGMKEMTSTTVGSLAPEELERLTKGIKIYSDEALARLLQDYGS